ncbi:MAG: hypothetical protein ACTSX6_07520 [Candidatus Heimdallarchaeaceae archaeon]
MKSKFQLFWEKNRSIVIFIVISLLLGSTILLLLAAIIVLIFKDKVGNTYSIIALTLFLVAFVFGSFTYTIFRFKNKGT